MVYTVVCHTGKQARKLGQGPGQSTHQAADPSILFLVCFNFGGGFAEGAGIPVSVISMYIYTIVFDDANFI